MRPVEVWRFCIQRESQCGILFVGLEQTFHSCRGALQDPQSSIAERNLQACAAELSAHTLVRRRQRQTGARRRSSVNGKFGLRSSRFTFITPGVWPTRKNRARRRASASLAFTGKVS